MFCPLREANEWCARIALLMRDNLAINQSFTGKLPQGPFVFILKHTQFDDITRPHWLAKPCLLNIGKCPRVYYPIW